MSFKFYDVDGHDEPLYLSPEHAEIIGATPHVPTALANGGRVGPGLSIIGNGDPEHFVPNGDGEPDGD